MTRLLFAAFVGTFIVGCGCGWVVAQIVDSPKEKT